MPFQWVKDKIDDTHDTALTTMLRRVLSTIGPMGLASVEDPYQPMYLRRRVQRGYWKFWSQSSDHIEQQVLRTYGRGQAEAKMARHLKTRRLEFWPSKPPLLIFGQPGVSCSDAIYHLGRALRARFLYAEQPADGSQWKIYRDPLGILISLLKFSTRTSVACFSLLFVLMDRRDEYQLVRFILKFKSISFITSGVVPLCLLGLRSHGCLEAIEDGDAQRCVSAAVSSSDWFPYYLGLELVRICLIWAAFVILAMGGAVGGMGELAALEHVRLDLADGNLDGQVDVGQQPANFAPRKVERMPGVERMRARLEEQRKLHGAERRVGGALPYFMIYDVCVLLVLTLLWALLYALPRGVDVNSPVFWSSLYNLRTAYGLASWPFFIFEIPLLGVALHQCVFTAYDQTGGLVPKLTKLEVAARYRQDLAASVIEQYWRSEGHARLRQWRQRNMMNPDYSDDRWLRRQLEAAVGESVTAVDDTDTRGAAMRLVDYEEAKSQARLCIETGMRGPDAVQKAAHAVVMAAVAQASSAAAAAPAAEVCA